MNVIDLVGEEADVDMADKTQNRKTFKKNFIFKKNLIFEVRKHPALYDNKHKFFSNIVKKDQIWQKISKHLKTDVDVCKNTWIQLRFGYQRHARRLQAFLLNGHKENCRRPAMSFEYELIFLWPFIENRKTSSLPFDILKDIEESKAVEEESTSQVEIEIVDDSVEDTNKESNRTDVKDIDDDLILVEQPVELIVIDEDDDNGKSKKQFRVTSSMKNLIEQIKNFPELYNSEHAAFNDYSGKSLIWNGIASKLKDKATKLMKCWIVMQTRYEWELMHWNENTENTPSQLQKQLEFLQDYILKNPNTVYKQSYYLKTAWFEPIDYFKDIYNLIVRMKRVSDIIYITDSLLKSTEKTKQYLSLWSEVATSKGSTAGQCESTWLIMRHFYWELMSMRKFKYQLTDKWYFEIIITELYAISRASQMAKQNQLQTSKENKITTNNNKTKRRTYNNEVSNNKKSSSPITTITTTTTATAANSTEKIITTVSNNLQSLAVTTNSAVSITPSTATTAPQARLIMPKITAAISLAPQAVNTNPLYIERTGELPNVQQQSFTSQKQITNGTVTTSVANFSIAKTPLQQQLSTTTPMQMSVNLPNQLQAASVPTPFTGMPFVATSQPIAGAINTSSKLISVNSPNNTVRQVPPQINVMPNFTTTSTINPNTRPIMIAPAQQASSLSLNTAAPTIAPTPPQPITSLKLNTTLHPFLSTIKTNQLTPVVNTNPLAVSTPMSSTTSTTCVTTNSRQLPKISSAVSLLNPNEILIELIASQSGNHLVVHGPPLSTKYQLPMSIVAKFIREVLGIPLLHNKRHNQPGVINNYWERISKLFNLPVHICRACWNFLLENFNHFPQIAPLKELMRPFPTTFDVWMESTTLFQKFDDHCVSMGWLVYMDYLPEVIECIGNYPVLYNDIAKQTENSNKQSDMEALCAWRTINLRFPKIPPLKEIWKSLKNCFSQYMTDLEFSIENKWPLNWWRALARLKFLVEAKYTTSEPFYYIVSNKMVEEIDRCAILEMKTRYTKVVKPEEIPSEEIKIESREDDPLTLSPITNNFMEVRKDVELGTLLIAMQKQPAIFEKADIVAKYEAWQNVARELHMDVIDCLMAFKKATQNYYAFKKQDPLRQCRINEKYYKRLEEIINTIKANKASMSGRTKFNIKTPFELNQSMDALHTNADCVFPERFISEINMTNCSSNLVVKNWVYGFGNYYSFKFHNSVKTQLDNILKKYLESNDDV